MVVNQEKALAEKVRSGFPILRRKVNDKPLVYFDNAEASQKPSVVINALLEYYEQYNSSVHRSMHVLGKEITSAYEEAREKIAYNTYAEIDAFIAVVKEAINNR